MLAAVAVLAGCNKHVIEEPGDKGSFALSLSYEGEYATKAEVPQVNVDEFKVTLRRSADGWSNVFTYAELKGQIENKGGVELTPGHYDITATSPKTEPAAFEQPIFSGSSSFDVEVGKVTSVSLVCTLQNMMVSIVATDGFNNELSQYDVIVSNGSGSLTWTKTEVDADKPGFFTVAPLHVKVSAKRTIDPNGENLIFEGDITNVAAKDHHIITLKAVATGAVGGIGIDIDYTTNKIYSGFEVPGFDEEGVPGGEEGGSGDEEEDKPGDESGALDGLSLSWPNNPTFKTYELKSSYNEGEVDLEIYSKYGIKNFLVKIASPHEDFISAIVGQMGAYMDGEYAVLDLMDPDVAEKMSTGLSLPAGDDLKGEDKTIPFKLKELLPFITYFDGLEIGSVHTFVMEVTDSRSEKVENMEDQILSQSLYFEYKGN